MRSEQRVGLVELLVSSTRDPRPAPDDLDILTEAGGETDAWSGPDDLDIVTRADGEIDAWSSARMADPEPRPEDLDTITFSEEADSWS